MVMLASYESLSQHCAGIVTCLSGKLLLKAKMKLHSLHVCVVMNQILAMGFCRPWASAQGLLMATINTHMQCAVLLWVCYTLNWCVMIPEMQC